MLYGKPAWASGARLPLQVCRSGAGFYPGTTPQAEDPYRRESVGYRVTQEAAEQALATGDRTQRDHP